MKSEVKNDEPSKRVYPWIGRSEGLVVLFSREKVGIVLKNTDIPSVHKEGDYSDSWKMFLFEEFKGSITLSN